MNNGKLLIIDDEALMLELCSDLLENLGYSCISLQDSLKGMETIKAEKPDLVISDLHMPGLSGMELLRLSKESYPDLPFIIITGQGTIESAFEAVALGADDYVGKPFQSDELGIRISQCIEKRRISLENQTLRRELERAKSLLQIIGKSRAITSVHSLIERAAPTVANVMIIGESGTGKEMTARALHQLSNRSDNPFIAVDCVSLPDQLFESELFGHVKGAFTGATDDKMGLFEMANGGTLFLDEITEMNFDLQGKLLRVLQERKFRRVGGHDLIDLDVRLVTATNRIPSEAVDEQRLRLDLYYRLNVIPINLPPLREREGDIVELLHHFLNRYSKANHQKIKPIQPAALDALISYHWPGNIRELQNLAERLVILATGESISLQDLPPEIIGIGGITGAVETSTEGSEVGTMQSGTALRDSLQPLYKLPLKSAKQEFLRLYVEKVVESCDGRITAAAKHSGVNRRTIHRVLAENGIDPRDLRKPKGLDD